ncbi:IS3 family transposase [Ideonella dechloratans]|uniref:IS3 family transposase n=1 Tax=Ideonella dechloratans TaxID=36863 RepID=A0A643F8X1_IDEDE|nr:IS3 family transposase [Ideonella dechloratans]KAB0573874.1 IS3 family transposase [Ideonella dechloratans]
MARIDSGGCSVSADWLHYADPPLAPIRRSRTGAITPIIGWLQYADHEVAPLRRSVTQPKQLCSRPNELWSMDFVADAPFDGRKLRMLTVVDCYTRECLAIDVGQSLKGEDVVNSLNRICAERGSPKTIKTDNGSEFISKAMDRWGYERQVELDFSRPGKPTDNARVESFNGRLRQECLNTHWFLSLDDAKAKIAAWRADYNENRPHSALGWSTPADFARSCRSTPSAAIPEEPEVSTSERY